ncbi:hypothetical protein CDL15_Pgr010833 [Punica granatum]|uniref:Uncharacterized protein n=1 Tax=Punica granatum TaxID=22663 RepID=A0A218W555_PUNGR|nr:hypothetical protein CDL15_Pgr010833 [Punica granatum]
MNLSNNSMTGSTGTRPGSQSLEPERHGVFGPLICRGQVVCSGKLFRQCTRSLNPAAAQNYHKDHQNDQENIDPSKTSHFSCA